MQELEWYVDGYKTKDALQKQGLRRLYHVLYNVNSKKPFRTAQALHKAWPLYIDNKVEEGEELLEEDDLRNHYAELRKRVKENDERSRTTNNTFGGS